MDNVTVDEKFDILEYLQNIMQVGRGYLPQDKRKEVARLLKPLDFEPGNPDLPKQWGLWERFLWCENFTNHEEQHNYTSYTFTPVLDQYLGVGTRHDFWTKNRNALRLTSALFVDWLEFESNSLELHSEGSYQKTGYVRTKVEQRVKKLGYLVSGLETEDLCFSLHKNTTLPTHDFDNDVEFLCNVDSGLQAVVTLTGLTCSNYHDEYMFLRVVQITECIFFIISDGVKAGLHHYSRGDVQTAADIFRQLTFHMDSLKGLFGLLDTMPVDNFFNGFRADTGNAGAIQSEKYQYLESLLTGIKGEKLKVIKGVKELSNLREITEPSEANLSEIYSEIVTRSDCPELVYFSNRLLREFQHWKAKHFGIAVKMLPKDFDGGGTGGIAYLRSNLRPNEMSRIEDKKNEHNISVSERARREFKGIKLGWVQLKDINFSKLSTRLDHFSDVVEKAMVDRNDAILANFEDYERLFATRKAFFPLKRQFTNGLPKRSANIIPRLLLQIEFNRGILAGIFDMTKVRDQILFDVSVANERYDGMGKSDTVCCENELVMRDTRGVMASYFSGPGRRTAMSANEDAIGRNVAIFFFSSPDMELTDVEESIDFTKELFLGVAEVTANSVLELS